MANRRMFAKSIVTTDQFLSMPLSTQLLYFQLGMQADDDGFVGNPRGVQRLLGCTDDEVKLLIAKQYIIPFESGVIVIKHWKLHNSIQKDRYTPTIYTDEKAQLAADANVYTRCIQDVQHPVYISETQLGKVNKVSVVKDNIPASADAPAKPARHKYGQYENVLLSDEDMTKLKNEFPVDWEQRIERLSEYIASKGAKYKNHLATIRSWARKDKPKEDEKQEDRPKVKWLRRGDD